jgi:hypothetical protein
VLSVNERWLEILLTPMRDQITVADVPPLRHRAADVLRLTNAASMPMASPRWSRCRGGR